jgi:translation initiation factor 3 subunit A
VVAELMNVGQKQAALQALHDLITSKRYRAWQKTLEKIMFKYVELCVDMKKGRFAKDGLIQYRNVCQQVNVSSLEEVIKYFLQLSSERAEQAQAQAAEVTLDIEDLEAEKRPEDLMMSYGVCLSHSAEAFFVPLFSASICCALYAALLCRCRA